MESLLRRWLPACLVVLALAGASMAAGGPGVQVGLMPPPTQDPPTVPESGAAPAPATAAPGTGEGPPPASSGQVGRWLGAAVTVLIVGLAVGTVVLLLAVGVRVLLTQRVTRREIVDRPASQPAGELEIEQVRDAVRAGLADLDAGGDPRRAVIACWLRLEQVAAAVGSARLAADTPADLVTRLLAAHRVDRPALDRLAAAYRLARYAPAAVDDELVHTARQAFGDVDAQLRERRPAEPTR